MPIQLQPLPVPSEFRQLMDEFGLQYQGSFLSSNLIQTDSYKWHTGYRPGMYVYVHVDEDGSYSLSISLHSPWTPLAVFQDFMRRYLETLEALGKSEAAASVATGSGS